MDNEPNDILADALGHAKSFAAAAVRIRDKYKNGTAALKDIEGRVEAMVDAAIAKAEDSEAAFKAEIEKEETAAKGALDDLPSSSKSDDEPSDPNSTRDVTPMPDAIAKRDAPTTPTVTTPTPTTTIAVVPAAATEPAVVSTAIGDVTVQPGTTVHVDAATMPDDPAVTTVPHDGTAPSAQTVSGAEVAPDPVIVAAVKVASADAGVTVQAKG